MKVTLDLDKLRREKRITQEEYTKPLDLRRPRLARSR